MSDHLCGCSVGVGQRCTCAAIRTEQRPRDYAALYRDGRCVLCDTPAYAEAVALHAEKHLATGEACMQLDYRTNPVRWRLYLTRDVPLADATGISVFEHDGDHFDRTDTNAEHLRAALIKARVLAKATARKIRAARKAAGA